MPMHDDAGATTGLLGLFTDVSERKRAEAALRDSEDLFRNMADTAPVMIWVAGPDKLCTFFNQGWLNFTGRTMQQELGSGWAEGVHPEDRDRCLEIYSSSFDMRRSCQMEYRLRAANGEYRWVIDNGIPRFGPGGDFAGFIGSCVDVTEVKRMQELALARQKLESVGVLADGIAHDFNNLLGSILANSELAMAELPDGSPAREEVEAIKAVAIRASEVVRELMAYAGQENTVFEPVDVSRLAGEMLQLLKVSISKRAILKADLPEGLPAVPANARRSGRSP
jgi:two-component system cell cycle sensor histidine kinase/response regulator CckA